MSLSPAAQELDEDLRLLFDGRTIGNGPASERVFGADEGVPRTVGESRDRYRKPIVEAFAESGAKTLAEFPERVRDLCERAALRDETRADAARLLHERDDALTERNDALDDLCKTRKACDSLCQERDNLYETLAKARTQIEHLEHKLANAEQTYSSFRVESFRHFAAKDAKIDRLSTDIEHLQSDLLRACGERDQALATADRYHAELIDVGQNELYVLRKERDAAKAMNTHLVHERDMAKAEANRYHEELTALRESQHAARMDATTAHQDCARLRMAAQDSELETNRLKRENAALKDAKERLTAERNEMAALQRDTDILRSQWSATRTAYRGTCDQLTEARRELEPMRVELAEAKATIAKLTVEKRVLKYRIRRLCSGFGKALAGDL